MGYLMMLGDDNKSERSVGMAKVQAHRKQVAEEIANNDDCPHVLNSSLVRLLNVPTLNFKANAYTTNLPILILTCNNFQQLQTRQQPPEIVLFRYEVSLDTTQPLYVLLFSCFI